MQKKTRKMAHIDASSKGQVCGKMLELPGGSPAEAPWAACGEKGKKQILGQSWPYVHRLCTVGLGGREGLHPDTDSGDLDLSPPLLAVWQSHSQTWRVFFPFFICYKSDIKPVS